MSKILILFLNKITTLLPLEFATTIWSSISDIWFSGKGSLIIPDQRPTGQAAFLEVLLTLKHLGSVIKLKNYFIFTGFYERKSEKLLVKLSSSLQPLSALFIM